MDFSLIRTFLEVAATGSFAAASDRLFVTQSAVSLRVQRLEDQLGRPLFLRSKSGVELTAAGRDFEGHAVALLRAWEEARQQIAVPEGFSRSLVMGGELSLWPRLGFGWMTRLRAALGDLSLRAEIGTADQLSRAMAEGVMQVALMSTPTLRPGLGARKILDEELVLVAPWSEARRETLADRYAYIDWGSDFLHFHGQNLPELTHRGLTLDLGILSERFVTQAGVAAYLPARTVAPRLAEGVLHLVPDAPTFPYPVWYVWREDLDPALADVAEKILLSLSRALSQEISETIEQI
ncbi:LysR family transcriptional regulator [Plastorhodobacter daqingensis]|uniref:LysR family transcriptional regulator n=1 Tax=Plastorhodobacter daqingensis TaxID=1387281 RepID=A0ABW2UK68_9RHOB